MICSPSSIEQIDVPLAPLARCDAFEDLEHPLRPDAAERALPAALVLREVQEEPRDVDHAGRVVHDDHAARSHDGARLRDRLVVDGSVHELDRHAAARRAAELNGLERTSLGDAAADLVDDLADRQPHRDLDESAAL